MTENGLIFMQDYHALASLVSVDSHARLTFACYLNLRVNGNWFLVMLCLMQCIEAISDGLTGLLKLVKLVLCLI